MRIAPIVLAAGAALEGCAPNGSSPDPRPTVITGTVDARGFPTAPHALSVVRDDRDAFRIPLGDGGAFRVEAPRFGKYRLSVLVGTDEVPIVFPRFGRVDIAFNVDAIAAVVDLGVVRSADSGTVVLAHSCTDVDAAQLCTVDRQQVSCDDGSMSTPSATCADISIVFGRGSFDDVRRAHGGRLVAVPESSPPCAVRGCGLPDPAPTVAPQ